MLFILNVQSVDDICKLTQLFRKFLTKFFRITAIPGVKKAVLYIYTNVHFSVRHKRYVDPTVAPVCDGRNNFHHLRREDCERLSRIFRIYPETFTKLLVINYYDSLLVGKIVALR